MLPRTCPRAPKNRRQYEHNPFRATVCDSAPRRANAPHPHRLRLNACKSSIRSNSCSVRFLARRARTARTRRVLKILTVRCRAPQLAFLSNSKKWLAQKKCWRTANVAQGRAVPSPPRMRWTNGRPRPHSQNTILTKRQMLRESNVVIPRLAACLHIIKTQTSIR